MESPYFSSRWSNFNPRHRYSPFVREVPVHRPARPSPKVVSIPVHFVGSERGRSESDSALKIQKAFRGFLVRRSMKKIAAIKREVEEIEKKMSQKETVELIWRDAKERLRVNETLMSLLFRLDSVRGVDSGVRDCRKTVIKKAIALQERVDAIVAGDQTLEESKESGEGPVSTQESEPEAPEVDPSLESLVDYSVSPKTDADRTPEKEDQDPETEDDCDSEQQNQAAEPTPNSGENKEKDESAMADAGDGKNENEDKEASEDGDTMSESGSSGDPQSPMGAAEENVAAKEEDAMEIVEAADKDGGSMKEEDDSDKRSKELLERMVEENERMMALMADLYERNQVQTRLLSLLSQRVEQLERAFVCDKLRKKQKQKQRRAAVDCLDKCPDATAKKCGNRE
ncbi:IQ motif, EF-hand binding site [Parasponia andersonii]|uniref:IQ motif, EF-hand binding site n=1 Tax=Parasponia andersonii TaxID=3476 RepID=A0A2P5BST4_PARAD|nr:IQ motif, EF-hand binding site [Parasponia andersonii]